MSTELAKIRRQAATTRAGFEMSPKIREFIGRYLSADS